MPAINFIPLYSGGALHLINHAVPVVIDLEGLESSEGEWDACVEHNPERVAGILTRLEIGTINGLPCLNAYGDFIDSQAAWEIKSRFKAGQPIEGSIHPEDPEFGALELIPEGQKVQINGRDFVGPLKVLRRWKLYEGSFVGFGGDPGNHCEIAAKGKSNAIIGNERMDPEFKNYLINIVGIKDPESLDPTVLNMLERGYKAYVEAGGGAAEGECGEKKEGDVAAEGGDSATTDPEKKEGDVAAEGGDPAAADPEKKEGDVAAEGGDTATTDSEKKEPIAASGGRGNPAKYLSNIRNASTGRSGRPSVNNVLTVALLKSLGFQDQTIQATGGYNQQAMNEGVGSRYRNITLKGLFCEAFENRLGGRWTGRENGFENKALEMLAKDSIMATGGFSTISPLTIIQDILQLTYRAGFENFVGVSEKLSDTNYNDNLMEAKMANYDVEGGLYEVAADGELKHGTLVSEDITTQVYTYGNILTITEAMILNDRLDALSKLSGKMGRKAKIQQERAWFEAFMKNDSFWTTNRGNKITNTLSIDGLTAASKALAELETIGSTSDQPEFTELDGKYLLTPRALGPTAQTLYVDTKCDLIGTGSHLLTNPHVNMYEPVSSSYFGSKWSAKGGNDTHWALIGDPAIAPCMIISHLIGQDKPRIERCPVQPNILGYSWRSVYRYGISRGDWRGVVYSDGTV